MAERYPMLPSSFSPNIHPNQMGQQQHLQQLQQQDSHSAVPGFPEQGPTWQQIQQIQNQFGRPQSADMNPAHVNPQVAELLRNQQLARQGQQQQQQQQFAMGNPQMGGQPGGAQSFLDPSNQQQPSQSHPSFQNMGPSHQTLNNRNPMLQAFQQPNNSAAHRQLELMGLAHNQQPQNGPLNFANRMQQQAAMNGQPGMNQPNQPENFLSPSMQPGEAMRRPSPSHAAPQNPTASVSRANFLTLQERGQQMKARIQNEENQLVQLTSQRTRLGDAAFMDQVRTLSTNLKAQKEQYGRLLLFLQNVQAGLNGGNMNGGGMPLPPQQQQQQPKPPGQPWQPGPSQQSPFSNQGGGPQQNGAGQPGGPQAHPQNGHPMQNPVAVPPRSGPTPHQQGFPNQMQPNTSFPQPTANQETRVFPLPPLEKARFETVYKNFCAQRGLTHHPRMLSVEARPIDLYELHSQVMHEGGPSNVVQKDLWSVIGGRMGFVSFPASETEPAKSGPGVAQHLAHVYKEYLAAFDNVYMNTILARKDAMNGNRPMVGNGGPPPMRPGVSDPMQMQMIMAHAQYPLAELRRRNLPEQIIQFIENNRATLIRNANEQGMFNTALRAQMNQGGMNGNQPFGASPQNGGMPAHMQHPGRQFMQQQGMGGMQMQNPMENQQAGPSSVPMRPSRESLQAAMVYITKLRQEYSTERMRANLQNMPNIDLPAEQRMEYNTVLEQLHRACGDMDGKLPMLFAVLKKEDVVKRFFLIVQTTHQQRMLISSGSSRFLVNLESLRNMLATVQQMNESFATLLSSMMGKGAPIGIPNNTGLMSQVRPPIQNHPPQPPQSINAPPIPPQPTPPNRPPLNLQAPPLPRKKQPNAANSPTPPPVASASTPVANAPTPTHAASPQAPKSPKGKVVPKSKAVPKRRASKAAPPPPPEPVAVATAPSPASNKRARVEDEPSPSQQPGQSSTMASSSSAANEPSPPKRPKTEWEGPPSDALRMRAEQVENIKTEEDGAAFMEQMAELFKMANEGQDTLNSDFSETLDTIFKGFGAPTDEGSGGMPSLGMDGGSGVPQDGGPPVVDEFVEFFDFSSFGTQDDYDAGSKAATPDLISSSSTNPSPESGSEVDAAHQALSSDVKTEDFSDHLRLGVWKEVDGGESAYFHSGQWKWDAPMKGLGDQPWAVFGS